MKFIVTKDYEEVSEVMCQLMLKHMHTNKERTNIAITTGSTCVKGYEKLAQKVQGKAYFDPVHYYIFDEFWFWDEAHKKQESVCRISLDAKYFTAAKVKDDHIHDLDMENYQTFDADIQQAGGLDMVIMGIGKNGHFCGNQPGTFDSWNAGTRIVRCDATDYLKNYSHHLLVDDFHSEDVTRIPKHYITMGPKTIMAAKHIIFLLSGKAKAEVAKKAFQGPVTKDFPVSLFQLHPDVTVILDEEAAAQLTL